MSMEEKSWIPHSNLIIPGEHIVLRSLYQFDDAVEVFAFLEVCREGGCSVHFLNEDISVDKSGEMNVHRMTIMAYMHLKETPKMVADYIRFLQKTSCGEWATDRVEVIE